MTKTVLKSLKYFLCGPIQGKKGGGGGCDSWTRALREKYFEHKTSKNNAKMATSKPESQLVIKGLSQYIEKREGNLARRSEYKC